VGSSDSPVQVQDVRQQQGALDVSAPAPSSRRTSTTLSPRQTFSCTTASRIKLGREKLFQGAETLKTLFPTTLVGSYPQPEWLIDRKKLAARFPRACARRSWAHPRCASRRGAGRRDAARDPRPGGSGPGHHHRRRDPARELLQPFRHALEGVDIDNPGRRSTARDTPTRCRASSERFAGSMRWRSRI